MTAEQIDLDALEAVARAATPGPWWVHRNYAETVWHGDETETYWLDEHPDEADVARWDRWVETTGWLSYGELRDPVDAAHMATFDPPTVLALIERVRAAEALAYDRHGLLYRDRFLNQLRAVGEVFNHAEAAIAGQHVAEARAAVVMEDVAAVVEGIRGDDGVGHDYACGGGSPDCPACIGNRLDALLRGQR